MVRRRMVRRRMVGLGRHAGGMTPFQGYDGFVARKPRVAPWAMEWRPFRATTRAKLAARSGSHSQAGRDVVTFRATTRAKPAGPEGAGFHSPGWSAAQPWDNGQGEARHPNGVRFPGAPTDAVIQITPCATSAPVTGCVQRFNPKHSARRIGCRDAQATDGTPLGTFACGGAPPGWQYSVLLVRRSSD